MRIRIKSLIAPIVLALLLLTGCLLSLYSAAARDEEISQFAAENWNKKGSEINSAQLSCFISEDAGFGYSDIMRLRSSIEEKLTEKSVTVQSENETARLWIDAYSAEGRLTVKNDRTSVSAVAVGCGGDFFSFHPLPLLFGNYFSEADFNTDRVVIDENLAWQLYGSSDICGMELEIGQSRYVIVGVVSVGDGEVYKLAYGTSPRIYLSYYAFSQYMGDISSPITCYEALLPNLISGFAKTIVSESLTVSETEREIIENTGRYSTVRLIKALDGFLLRSMRTNKIIYPYWENTAAAVQDKLTFIMLPRLISAAAFCIILIVYLVYLWKRSGLSVRKIMFSIAGMAENKYYSFRRKRRRK